MVDEYYAIKNLSGTGYKLYSVIRMMTEDGKADEDGWIQLSFKAISNKLGISKSNIPRIVSGVEQFPEIIEVKRSAYKGSDVTRFRVNKKLLR